MTWSGSPDERISLVRRLFDATAEHDLAQDVYADDLYWSMPKGRGRLMGERRGRAAIDEAFGHVLAVASEYHSRTDPCEILADEHDTISFNRDWGVRAADGAEFDFLVAMRWEIVDGQITAMHEYIQDEEHKGSFF
jgi:ketosteroid isomerase-like protein